MLEKEFNMQVVNLGFHGSLRNRLQENVAKLNINTGDIVIICHSSYGDDEGVVDYKLLLTTFEWHKELWKIASIEDYIGMLSAIPSYLISAYKHKILGTGNKPSSGCYSRDAFNKYGDNIFSEIDKETRFVFKEGSLDKYPAPISDACVNRINELNEYVIEKGARLLIGEFPIADGEYTPDHSAFYDFETELKNRIECSVISSVSDYFFDYTYFYNTILHLTEDGAILRTEQLIKDLNNYLNRNLD